LAVKKLKKTAKLKKLVSPQFFVGFGGSLVLEPHSVWQTTLLRDGSPPKLREGEGRG